MLRIRALKAAHTEVHPDSRSVSKPTQPPTVWLIASINELVTSSNNLFQIVFVPSLLASQLQYFLASDFFPYTLQQELIHYLWIPGHRMSFRSQSGEASIRTVTFGTYHQEAEMY